MAELTSKLKITSRPNFSPRYLGEGSDNLMIANLAYMVAILYNPSNASGEANPATTFMEMETGSQLAQMVGFNPEKAWGHITACETISNFESLWISRNLKSIPLAIKAVKPDLVSNMDDWQLLNMTSSSILNLLDKIKKEGLIDVFDEVRDHSIRGTGLKGYKLGKLIVPQSEYNAWIKAVDIFGLGLDNLIGVSLDDNFRIDVAHLDEILDSLVKKNIPILQTVVSLGNYEGAVDYVDKVVQLREKYEKNGVSFRIHVDASCGGYAFSMFLDENHNFMNFETLKLKLHSNIIIHKEIPWPSKEVHQAYKAVCKTDSVTLAPHKAGYIPYEAAAVVMKDKRVLNLLPHFSLHLLEKYRDDPSLLSSYIMQGSKSGSTVATTWATHKMLPLNVKGYAKVVGKGIDGAYRLFHAFLKEQNFEINNKKYEAKPLIFPDLNVVSFAFNEAENKSLDKMNQLNEYIFEQFSYIGGRPVFFDSFIISKTKLEFEKYADASLSFIKKFNIDDKEWSVGKSVFLLRICTLNANISPEMPFNDYWQFFIEIVKEQLKVFDK